MMDLFTSKDYKALYPDHAKKGLRLHFGPQIHPYVRSWLLIYADWLREECPFPVLLNVYCRHGTRILCQDRSTAFGSIILPEDRSRYPYIKLACGSFQPDDPVSEHIQSETDLIMFTLTHEIMHYFQYIHGYDMTRGRGLEWQASYWSKHIFRYFDSLYDHED